MSPEAQTIMSVSAILYLFWLLCGFISFGFYNAYFRRRFITLYSPSSDGVIGLILNLSLGAVGLMSTFWTLGIRYGWTLKMSYPGPEEIAYWDVHGGRFG